jgi:hypothetical protein
LRRAIPHPANAIGYAMASLDLKLSILHVLARWPERRATLDEIKREIESIVLNGDQIEQLKRLPALHDADIFQSGLVSRDDDGFRITEAGLSLLDSLESSGGFSREAPSAKTTQPFRLIDDLLSREKRLKIFDLELRTIEGGAELPRCAIGRPPQLAASHRNDQLTLDRGRHEEFVIFCAAFVHIDRCIVRIVDFFRMEVPACVIITPIRKSSWGLRASIAS